MHKTKHLILLCIILFSCSDGIRIDKQLVLEHGGLKIQVLLHAIEYHEYEDGTSTFIKGKVFIRNISNEPVVCNLGNIYLAAGQDTSSFHVDSFASYVFLDETLAVNESIETLDNFYWAFEGKHNVDILNKLFLVYNTD